MNSPAPCRAVPVSVEPPVSKIAKEVTTLDKLSWAVYPEHIKIRRAAAMLRKMGYSAWHLDDDKDAKRELRLLVHKTAPGKGRILSREKEIKDEVCRQYNARGSRDRPYDPEQEVSDFRVAVEDKTDRQWHKQQLIRQFGDKLGIDCLKAFKKLPCGLMLLIAGSWSGYREVYIRRRYGGLIYAIKLNENKTYDRVEDLLAALPLQALKTPDPEEVFADMLLRGGKMTMELRQLRTRIAYPDGTERVIPWNYVLWMDGDEAP